MSGLLSIFNIAKRGMSAQQYSLSVTNHNIANANTEGYSRQRALLKTSTPFMNPSMNSYIGPGQIGTGVDVATVQRVRNEFIDYQIRGELATEGKYEAREALLGEIEYIFNEPTDSAISGLIGKFYDSWQQLSKQPQSSNARTVVAQQSKALTDELNHNYDQLNKLKENTNLQIKESVFKINNILDQIDSLNQQIISVKVSQQEPNDLMDRRDLLIDELNSLMNVDMKKQSFYGIDLKPEDTEGIPGGAQDLLVRKEPNMAVSRFSYISGIVKVNDDTYKIQTYKLGNSNEPGEDITVDLSAMSAEEKKEFLTELSETRVMWANEEGEPYAAVNASGPISITADDYKSKLGMYTPEKGKINGLQSVQKDVDKYIDQMNKLAKSIALAVNVIHSGVSELGADADLSKYFDAATGELKADASGKYMDFTPFFVNKDIAKYNEDGTVQNLFDVIQGEDEINAGNITINMDLLNNVMKIKTKTNDDKYNYTENNKKNGATDGNRALSIAQLRTTFFKIGSMSEDITRSSFVSALTGGPMEENEVGVKTIKSNTSGTTTDNYFKDVIDELGIQTQESKRIVQNQKSLISGFTQARDAVSGVSLDEEMANLIQYQSVYAANAKVVATVDELLDVVVNGLKR